MINFGTVRPGSTIYVYFDSFAASTGAPTTISGLATTDILIYKDGSTTERASQTGFTLLDTDGIDFDGKTGINGFSVDLSSDATADFYKAGSSYVIVIASVTIDGQTVQFVAATFDIGFPDALLNTSIATLASQTSFTLTVGPAEDDALNGMWAVVHDKASSVQRTWVQILDYTGATKTVTLAATPPATFTIAAIDNFCVMAVTPLQPTVIGRTADVSAGGELGLDWANVGSPTTALDLSGTTIKTTQVVASVTGAVGSVTARVTANADQWAGTTIPAPKTNGVPIVDWIPTGWRQNTAAGGAAGTITLDAAASAVNDFYRYSLIMLLSGTGAGQARVCIGYVQATKVATVVPNWTTNPDNTSVFATMPLAIASVEGWLGAVAPANTGDAFARIGAAGAGLTNIDLPNQTMDIVGNITGNLSGSVGSVTGAVGSVTGNVGGNVTGSVGSVVAAVAITAAAVQAIWDALTTALTTVGSIGKLLVTNIDALISSRTKPADTQARVTLVDTITAYTGNTPQTGDCYPIVSTLKIKKNTALAKFPFLMVLSADHITPATGLTVVVQRSINGAAFANATNTPATEVANGIYYIDLSAADLNGDTIVLKMTSATADQRIIIIATEP